MINSNSNGLIKDFASALEQQLFFWGCDVIHNEGNLLTMYGLERRKSEGKGQSSCYRMEFNDAIIELNGLCVGRYSNDGHSFLFTRQHKKSWLYNSEIAPLPGIYDKQLIVTRPAEKIEEAGRRFLVWWLEYENWICENTESNYREKCYNSFKRLPKSKAWLPPEIGIQWLREYLYSPRNLNRSREWKRKLSRSH